VCVYSEREVRRCYIRNLKEAKRLLAGSSFCCGQEPNVSGLNGWVFEQTVHGCLSEELGAMCLKVDVEEQVKIKGKAKADLKVGRVVIEIKATGLFDKQDIAKCRQRSAEAGEKRWHYVYLTLGETYAPYRDGMAAAIGKDKVFFLDVHGEWRRFVKRLVRLLSERAV